MERDVGEKCNNSVGAGGGVIFKKKYKIRKNKRVYHVPGAIKNLNQVKNHNL
jgi:hypothetical protein